MPDLHVEKNNEGKMIAFRAEIKRIQDRMHGKDGTIVEVKNLNNLEPADMESWEQCKVILRDVYNTIKDLQHPSELPNIDAYCASVKKKFDDLPLEDGVINEDRGFFVNWVRNIFSSLYYDLDFFESDFLDVKNDLHVKLQSYGLL